MHIFGYDMPRLHAALNDLPAALLLFAVLFDLAASALQRESLKWAAIWTLWAGVVGGWAAVFTGLAASRDIEHGEAIHELMETHETFALVTMGVFTLVLVWQLWRRFNPGVTEGRVLKALSVVGLVLLVRTALIGGQMMFEHGAGISAATMQIEMQDRAKGLHHHGGDEDEAVPADTAHADTAHVHAPGTPARTH